MELKLIDQISKAQSSGALIVPYGIEIKEDILFLLLTLCFNRTLWN